MDQNEQQMLETASKFNKHYYYNKLLKKSLQFLVPVSLLMSFLLSCTPDFSFYFPYNFNFSASVFSLFTHNLERKYLFLICNGLIAFLSKNLCLTCSSPGSFDPNGDFVEGNEAGVNLVLEPLETKQEEPEENELDMKSKIGSPRNVAPAEEKQEQERENLYLNAEGRESGILVPESDDAEGEDDNGGEGHFLVAPSSVEEGDEVNVNTDELNKKFDEFIKKMKQEIIAEAQRVPVTV